MHLVGELLLDGIEYILNWPIDRVIGSIIDKVVASSNDHLCNDWLGGDEQSDYP